MIITLKTSKKSAMNLFNIPLLGGLLFFLFAILPVPAAIITDEIFHYGYNSETGMIQIVTAIWNIILSYAFNIRIGIFFIPCWLLFLFIGCLKLAGL